MTELEFFRCIAVPLKYRISNECVGDDFLFKCSFKQVYLPNSDGILRADSFLGPLIHVPFIFTSTRSLSSLQFKLSLLRHN